MNLLPIYLLLLSPASHAFSRRTFSDRPPTRHHLSTDSETLDYPGRIPSPPDFRCGFCTIVGAPNAGKSTLMNALLKEDLCIATARPQTTRHAILGLLTTDTTQTCLVDTPGVIADPAYHLQTKMMEAVTTSLRDTDVLLVVADGKDTELPSPDDAIWQRVQKLHQFKPTIVVINKIELLQDTALIPQAVQQWRALLPHALAILPTTAADKQHPGIQFLRKLLTCSSKANLDAATRDMGRPIPGMFADNTHFLPCEDADAEAFPLLPSSPPLYDTELLTDRPERFIASEMIRQALFECLEKELPYCTEVQIDAFSEDDPGLLRLQARVIVERDSQKSIVIGKQGATIKQVGTAARRRLQDFFGTKIFLELRVVTDRDWRTKEDRLQQYGYSIPNKKK